MHNLSTMTVLTKKAYAKGKIIDKQTLADACVQSKKGSTKSGAFNHKLSALKHYNLADVEKNLVKFTLLADKIILGEEGSLKTAFLAPFTFKELYNTLEKEISLSKIMLEKIAFDQIGISNAGKKRFVGNFVKSGIYAGLVKHSLKSKDEIIILKNKEKTQNVQNHEAKTETNVQKAVLSTSTGKAVIVVPKSLSDKDKNKLKSQIDLF